MNGAQDHAARLSCFMKRFFEQLDSKSFRLTPEGEALIAKAREEDRDVLALLAGIAGTKRPGA